MIEFSRSGRCLAIALGDEVILLDTEGSAEDVGVSTPGLASFLVFDDELWFTSLVGEAATTHRVSLDGRSLGPSGPSVECAGRAPRLFGTVAGPAGAVLLADRAHVLRLVDGAIEAQALDEEVQFALPLGVDSWLEVRGGGAAVCGAHKPRALGAVQLNEPVLDGALLGDGHVCLVTGAPKAMTMLVVNVAEGAVKHRIALRGRRPPRVATRPARALADLGPRSLALFDLRFGRELQRWDEPHEVVELAVDPDGQRLALFHSVDGVTQLSCRTLGPPPETPEVATSSRPPRAAAAAAVSEAPARTGDVGAARPAPGKAAPPIAAAPRLSLAAPLTALQPRASGEPIAAERLDELLGQQRQLLDDWCGLAIAGGWDSGRLGYVATAGVPFEAEVAGILRHSTGHAVEHLARAEGRLAQQPDFDVHSGGDTPLGRLADEFGLSRLARQILLVVSGPSLWGHLARLFAIAANDKGRPVCDEYLVMQLLGERDRLAIAAELEARAPLVRSGLILVGQGVRPFADLRVDRVVARRLTGERFDRPEGSDTVTPCPPSRPLEELEVPHAVLEALLLALAGPPAGGPLRLVLQGQLGSGRRTLLSALAARAHRQLGVLDVARLSGTGSDLPERLWMELRRTVLRGWLPCLTGLDAIAINDRLVHEQIRAVLREHPGPLLFRAGPDAELPLDPGHQVVRLPPLSEDRRIVFWRGALTRHRLPVDGAETLAARYRVGPGIIEQVSAQVGQRGLQGTIDDLADALRQHRDARIGKVANRVTRLPTRDQVVLPADVLDSIDEFMSRIRHRRTVFDSWGYHRVMTSSRGLTALFSGGPGTGKTMVAGLIAGELGFDLYRVDLSRVLSKWIGETEQNLGAVFDAAEDGQAVIVFDEADSLFARRTEVKSSVDRYANVEVNYLLQRLDSFEGIAILTTNLAGSIDAAFKRRLSIRLTFPFPDEEMRAQLWRAHLPAELPQRGTLDLRGLAKRHQLSGGYIRNCALRAAFLAAKEGGPLTQDHLDRAVRLEYREMGKLTEGGVLE